MLIDERVLFAVRKVLEEEFLKTPNARNAKTLTGFCAISANVLAGMGIGRVAVGHVWYPESTPGYTRAEHCWNVTQDQIVDLTASQFGGPETFVGALGAVNPFGEYIEAGGTDYREWPEWQRPTTELIDDLISRVKHVLHWEMNPSLWS